jgi:hypothetical protein
MKEFKNINGNVTSSIEMNNGIKMFVMYEPFKVGTHRWGIILTEHYHQLVR